MDTKGRIDNSDGIVADARAPARRWPLAYQPWMTVPIGIALGVRVALLLFGDFAIRLLDPVRFAGILGTWDQFDAVWYTHIAQHGYDTPPPNNLMTFFPLYPLLMWPLGWLLRAVGIVDGDLLSGMLVA